MINLIAAVSKNGVIGNRGKLPWHFKKDLERFKSLTMGHCVVFGRKTFESLEKELEGRKIIVLTLNKNFQKRGIIVKHSVEDIINNYLQSKEICFIAGGEEIYKEFLPFCDIIYLSLIDKEFSGDKFFPIFEMNKFEKLSSEKVIDECVLIDFITLKRK
jgi:dihydrofolate reductase